MRRLKAIRSETTTLNSHSHKCRGAPPDMRSNPGFIFLPASGPVWDTERVEWPRLTGNHVARCPAARRSSVRLGGSLCEAEWSGCCRDERWAGCWTVFAARRTRGLGRRRASPGDCFVPMRTNDDVWRFSCPTFHVSVSVRCMRRLWKNAIRFKCFCEFLNVFSSNPFPFFKVKKCSQARFYIVLKARLVINTVNIFTAKRETFLRYVRVGWGPEANSQKGRCGARRMKELNLFHISIFELNLRASYSYKSTKICKVLKLDTWKLAL